MILQETFDTVVKHLLTQNARATHAVYMNCMYRTPEGLKCAAGCLIPDECYRDTFEGASLHVGSDSSAQNEAAICIRDLGHDLKLVRDLQTIHDGYDPVLWPNLLRELAGRYKLNTKVLDGQG